MLSDWSLSKLSEIIDFNPRESIKKGEIVTKVAMENLQPFSKFIAEYTFESFSSGSKFRNSDTIMARITPCLENGKTALVSGIDDQIAFGSTEFIVLRAKDAKSDPNFVYYLAISQKIREIAIQSMVGTSGRQRAQVDVLANYETELPTLPEQKSIARILSSLDDKIELYNRMNKTLEEIAQTLFKRWFVDFEFPDENGNPYKSSGGKMVQSELGLIPEGWDIVNLPDLFSFQEGPGIRNWQYVNDKGVRFINIRCIQNNDLHLDTASMISHEEANGKYSHFLLDEWDIVMSTSGTLGRYAIVRKEHLPLCLNTSVIRFKPSINAKHYSFMYGYLISNEFYEHLITKATGSVQANFGPIHLKQIYLVKPSDHILEHYDKVIFPTIKLVVSNRAEISRLTQLRDTLLPKLMSGEIRVPIDKHI